MAIVSAAMIYVLLKFSSLFRVLVMSVMFVMCTCVLCMCAYVVCACVWIYNFVFSQFAASLPEHIDRIVYIEGVYPLPIKVVSHEVFTYFCSMHANTQIQ